jgi:molecular chaperone HtpG
MSEANSKENADEGNTEFEFKAETQRVLSLVINSLYTNQEVFLRELISNASDALDRARFVQISDDSASEQHGEPGIEITLDKDARSLIIEDNGVGMTRDEAIANLGTIARSGTTEFVAMLGKLAKEKKDGEETGTMDLIGEFGVGFYAVFMVASRVDVHTLSMNEGAEAVLWRSSGEGSFNVLPGERDKPGTRIVIALKEDAAEFAEAWRIKAIIEKYSDFVTFPIKLDGEVANQSSALWRQPRSQVTEEQHTEFFKHITHGQWGEAPAATIHYSVDAPVQFSALLYIPEKPSPQLYMMQKERPGLRLYAKRILIQQNCEALTPTYLRFVRGVVDSEDLTLNVSRETLQEDRVLTQIATQLTKQVLKELARIADKDPDRYAKIWEAFGPVIKEGVSMDWKNKDAIAKLCRFESLQGEPEDRITLDGYVTAKKEDQKTIYYMTGADSEQLRRSPHLEVFRKHDIDVLLLTDPIDEWFVQGLTQYEDCPLTSVVHGKLDLGNSGDEANEEDDKDEVAIEKTVEAIKSALGDKVSAVRASTRLTETASCLVSQEGAMGANMERLMKMVEDRKSVV